MTVISNIIDFLIAFGLAARHTTIFAQKGIAPFYRRFKGIKFSRGAFPIVHDVL